MLQAPFPCFLSNKLYIVFGQLCLKVMLKCYISLVLSDVVCLKNMLDDSLTAYWTTETNKREMVWNKIEEEKQGSKKIV